MFGKTRKLQNEIDYYTKLLEEKNNQIQELKMENDKYQKQVHNLESERVKKEKTFSEEKEALLEENKLILFSKQNFEKINMELQQENTHLWKEVYILRDILKQKDDCLDAHFDDIKNYEAEVMEFVIKYDIAVEQLARYLTQVDEAIDLQFAKEYIEELLQCEYEKKRPYAEFINVLKMILKKKMIKEYEEKSKAVINDSSNTFESDIINVPWYKIVKKQNNYSISKYDIVSAYIIWYKDDYLEQSNIERLKQILNKHNWDVKDAKALIIFIKTTKYKRHDISYLTWDMFIEEMDTIIDLSFEDIISLYCVKFFHDTYDEKNVNMLKEYLLLYEYDYSQLRYQQLIKHIKRIEDRGPISNCNYSWRNTTGNDYVLNTYHPHYGTEFVSGHYRVRNGRVEYVRAHTRRR